MELDKILAVSGKPGLYELMAKTRGGFIIKSLENDKKMPINLQNNVSILSEIAIYTYTEEIPLKEVFLKINEKEEGKEAISHKSPAAELKAYFSEVLPDYDENRVYPSDIKKVIQWYNLLQTRDLLDFEEEENTVEETEESSSKTD
ncbi:MAG: DUF5606 domain-containing protein [Psychroflexus sp.]|nr:DUF5606 domain-containing protein [Psychroflexus sp.]MDN6309968.1 DUF5606 domain-containing protein [Psychroflexus sp.]